MKKTIKTEKYDLEIVTVTEAGEILELCQNSAMALEGLDADSINEYMDYLVENTFVLRERVFVISGKLMNSVYRLVDENKYPDHTHIVCIILKDVLIDEDIYQKISELGAVNLNSIVQNHWRMEIRRRAKNDVPAFRSYSAKDVVLNRFKTDKSLKWHMETKPGLSISPLGLSLIQTGEAETADEDIEKIFVEDRKMLDRLYDEWALTVEGMPLDYLPLYMDFLKMRTTIHRKRVYIIMGSTMNNEYGLTGSNAYKDDLHLVSVSREDVNQDEMAIAIDRSVVGARFFNDIVDNNQRHERGNTEEDDLQEKRLMQSARGLMDPDILKELKYKRQKSCTI